MSQPRLLIATRSPHKLAELRDLLALEQAELVSLEDLGLEGDIEEAGSTFEANARMKARHGARLSGLMTLAGYSGLEVEAMGGWPGDRTRRYAGEDATDAEKNTKLLADLTGLPPQVTGT